MKLRIILSTLLLAFAGSLFAQQRSFTYQGMLLDAAKRPVTGEHSIIVRLYDAPTGGEALHDESFTTSVNDGLFNVVVGSQTAISKSVKFDKQYWLGISVDGGAEMMPRTALTSVPYATHADAASSLTNGATGAVTSLNGASGDLEFKGGPGTFVETEGKTITITSIPIDHQEPQEVAHSVTGTQNQVLVDGTYGQQRSGDVILSLPQSIHSSASPTFAGMILSSMPSSSTSTTMVVSNSGTLETRSLASLSPTFSGLEVDGNIHADGTISTGNTIVIDGASMPRTITADDNLSISTTSGTISINGLTFPETDGEPNQIMTTNGSGILGWTDGGPVDWHQEGGNDAGATSFVGTNNNTPLRLQVRDGETINNSLILDNNGSIGIGTTTPSGTLDISGSGSGDYPPGFGGTALLALNATDYNPWAIAMTNAAAQLFVGQYVDDEGAFHMDGTGVTFFTIAPNGNFGIGDFGYNASLDIPEKLSVSGSALIRGNASVEGALRIVSPTSNNGYGTIFECVELTSDISYTLPTALPTNKGAMVCHSSGGLNWGSYGRVTASAGTSQTISDGTVNTSSTILVTIEGTVTSYAITARNSGTSFTITTAVALTTSDMINYQILP